MWDSSSFLGALTPKFYVALTGTSSLISGLILIFEWWYFRKYGTSFIEQVTLTYVAPLLGITGSPGPEESGDFKVWRNPMSLLRGAEYGRLWNAVRRSPLTYYDMSLSAQEHHACFNVGTGAGPLSDADEVLARAWREREPATRVACARAALALRPDCAAAMLLLAEEDAPTVAEAERMLRRAWRLSEVSWRGLMAAGLGSAAKREAVVLAHIKRRVAMCARRLGRLREAVRIFRELARDAPPALAAMQLHENLIEVLLEQRAYADVQAVLARHDDAGLPRSAAVCYTTALLRARAAASPSAASASARAQAEAAALDALHRAIQFNPHVPQYLLELRPVTLPPEHVMKRGDSEAVAYAFFHLPHWQRAEGAVQLLSAAWEAAERGAERELCGECQQSADRQLLPSHHPLSVFPPRRAPTLLLMASGMCSGTALLALAAHRYPAAAAGAICTATEVLDPRRLLLLLSAQL